MTVERVLIPKNNPLKKQDVRLLKEFVYWLDAHLEIEEYVSIKFKNFTNEPLWGWCEPNAKTGDIDVVINLTNANDLSDALTTVAHEYVHVNQHDKETFTMGEYAYKDDPNEHEAWDRQEELVNAGIAQLVEQGFCKPQVGSSNLPASTTLPLAQLDRATAF